jgi:sigma-B regulation protein RsbQ
MGNPERPELAGELENSFCQNDPKIAKHFARVTFTGENRSDLKNVEVKSLIIQSNQDAIAGIDVGKYVHENIKNSEFVIIDAIGHCPHLSAPKATAFAIKNYLN